LEHEGHTNWPVRPSREIRRLLNPIIPAMDDMIGD
jgi:hypothetical protein